MIFGPPELPPDDPPAVVDVQRPTEVLAEGGDTVAAGQLSLTWAAPEPCPDAAAVMETVQRYLSEDAQPQEAVVVRGEVEARGELWRLDMAVNRGGNESRRTLEANSCELLGKGAALLVAVHVDAVGTSSRVRKLETPDIPALEELPGGEVRVIDAPPPESTVTVVEPPPPPRGRPLPDVGGLVRFTLTGGVGDIPRFPRGFAVAGGLSLARFRLEAQLDYAVPRPASHPNNGAIGGRFQSVAGTLRGCFEPRQGRWSFPLCLGIRGTGVNAEAVRGVRTSVSVWSGWAAVALEPAVVFSPVPRVGIYGSVGALASMNRPGFAVGTENAPIFRVAAISALVSVGVEVNFSARIRGSR